MSDTKGSLFIAMGQVSVTDSATLVAAFRDRRRAVTLKNLDSSTTAYVGPSGVAVSTGQEVEAGESITLYTRGAVYAIVSSGSVTIAFNEEYD